METVNRNHFIDALFVLMAVLLASTVLVFQPFTVHVSTPAPITAATVTQDACSTRAAQGNWNANMFDGSQYNSCRALYPYDNSVVYSPITGQPVAP